MTVRSADRLHDLLPAVFREPDLARELRPDGEREQDGERELALRALLRIVQSQLDVVEDDIAGLWNDLFIETCAPWVIPYLGDLVSNNLLYDASRIGEQETAAALFTDLVGPDLRPPIATRTRADVAKTIYYRRRKGTLPMLEELARDVTGWAAHAVEFFELLGWTQHLEHLRPQASWFEVRSLERNERVDGAFDEASHSVDVRPIGQAEGWHSIKNVGFFLWRLGSYELTEVDARPAGAPWQFHFSPLGNAAPLFTRLRREGDETGLATELHVPGPIRRAYFARDLSRHATLPPPDSTDLYGTTEVGGTLEPHPQASLFVTRNGQQVAPAQVVCRRLDPWPAAQPAGAVVAIDVAVGRIAVGSGFAGASELLVMYHYGFPAGVGGGPYRRRQWLVAADPAAPLVRFRVASTPAPGVTHPDVASALAAWSVAGRPDAVISIADNRTYALPSALTLADTSRLLLEAEDGRRPVLRTGATGFAVDADGTDPDPERRGLLTLSGVVVEGFVHVRGDVGRLRLVHATLVPGRTIAEGAPVPPDRTSVVVDATSATGAAVNKHFRLEVAFGITGPLECPEHAEGIWLLDSIVDGAGGIAISAAAGRATAPLVVERTTILGQVRAYSLEASEAIFDGLVRVRRTQSGCVRFSYVPPSSRTPRRHRCQPDLAVRRALDEALTATPTLPQAEQDAVRAFVAGRVRPSFVADDYGRPAYCQLRLASPVEIRTGAADGSEMGVYQHVKQPQRESNLRIRLDEYLPFGLEAGAIFVT